MARSVGPPGIPTARNVPSAATLAGTAPTQTFLATSELPAAGSTRPVKIVVSPAKTLECAANDNASTVEISSRIRSKDRNIEDPQSSGKDDSWRTSANSCGSF